MVDRGAQAPPSSGGGGGISFNMTAGPGEEFAPGYYSEPNPISFPAGGSIDAEPIPGHSIGWCGALGAAYGFPTIYFRGDCLATVTGLSLYVDGVVQPSTAVPGWSYDAGDDATLLIIDGTGPAFVDGISYFIEIK